MDPDAELLRRYVEERSEAAFTQLLATHLDLVYSAALRQVAGDTHLARDVAQVVFSDLARKAPSLLGRPSITGWLYVAAHHVSAVMVRTERRRRTREQEAQTMHEILSENDLPGGATDWSKLRPVLDDAMVELDEDDREAVLLRFFEGRSFEQVGNATGLSGEAARKRVGRALDKLHALLARRGVTSTAAVLAGALSEQAVLAAPSGLAAALASTSWMGAIGGGSGLASVLFFMNKTKVLVGTIFVAIAVGIGSYQLGSKSSGVRPTPLIRPAAGEAKLRQEVEQLRASNQRLLEQMNGGPPPTMVGEQPEGAKEPAALPELTRTGSQRRSAVRNNLLLIRAAERKFEKELGRQATSFDELLAAEPAWLKDLKPEEGEVYAGIDLATIFQEVSLTTPAGLVATLPADNLEAINASGMSGALQAAKAAYADAHGGQAVPENSEELLPYIADAIYREEYAENLKLNALINALGGTTLLQKAQPEFEAAYHVRLPSNFQDMQVMARFLDDPKDRTRFLEVWNQVNSQHRP